MSTTLATPRTCPHSVKVDERGERVLIVDHTHEDPPSVQEVDELMDATGARTAVVGLVVGDDGVNRPTLAIGGRELREECVVALNAKLQDIIGSCGHGQFLYTALILVRKYPGQGVQFCEGRADSGGDGSPEDTLQGAIFEFKRLVVRTVLGAVGNLSRLDVEPPAA